MSSPSIAAGRQGPLTSRAIPLTWILLLALAVHIPLLLMQLPNDSYDANSAQVLRVPLRAALV